MSEILNRVFPEEQCLSEAECETAETVLKMDLFFLLQHLHPYDRQTGAPCHVEQLFACDETYARKIGINFVALEKIPNSMASIREKLQ